MPWALWANLWVFRWTKVFRSSKTRYKLHKTVSHDWSRTVLVYYRRNILQVLLKMTGLVSSYCCSVSVGSSTGTWGCVVRVDPLTWLGPRAWCASPDRCPTCRVSERRRAGSPSRSPAPQPQRGCGRARSRSSRQCSEFRPWKPLWRTDACPSGSGLWAPELRDTPEWGGLMDMNQWMKYRTQTLKGLVILLSWGHSNTSQCFTRVLLCATDTVSL